MEVYYSHNPDVNIRQLLDNMPYCFESAYSSEKYSFSAIIQDITDIKQRKEALIESEKKYKELTESTELLTLMRKWRKELHEYLINKD
ncbi:MAG: hypothetical protein ACYDG2_17520 [Ruminiclostridium sp.]